MNDETQFKKKGPAECSENRLEHEGYLWHARQDVDLKKRRAAGASLPKILTDLHRLSIYR